jgi:VWFA-related protein
MKPLSTFAFGAAIGVVLLSAQTVAQSGQAQQDPQRGDQPFRFRTGVELINVTATVTDANGRFVPGLRQQDFRVYQDDEPQEITHFASERVPVSLGIVLDTSGSMEGEKMAAARDALDRFLYQLLDPQDEVFLYKFDGEPELVQGWTTDRSRISRELSHIQPRGGTALYDAVAEAIPMAQAGSNRKKALLIISDGNDTGSHMDVWSLKRMIRETEVLVYAIGIDARGSGPVFLPIGTGQGQRRPPRLPIPFPFPTPGGRPRPPVPPNTPTYPPPQPQPRGGSGGDERVNENALREITDDSGGRTEIIRGARDLDPATAGIADELSKQYYLGYSAKGPKDGRWHTIRVEVRNQSYHVRARRGFIATP